MPLPISGNKFDQLGARLVAAGQVDPSDLGLLETVLAAYDDALTEVRSRLRTIGHEATTRLKTTQTLVDKLRRTPGMTIRGIHDIAGARIVLDGGRFKQDKVVQRILEEFAGDEKPPLRLDRRSNDSYGYRAVHVVVYVSRLPVEIQIRTDLQHRWAEVVERLADQWGRGLRYGVGPEDPDRLVLSDSSTTLTRREFIAELMQWSETVDEFEKTAHELSLLHAAAGETSPQISALYERLCNAEDGLRGRLKLYLMLCDHLR